MLRSLNIRNLAVIEQLEVEFDAGMTVLTGETGAGKSILVDSLGLVLGDRADTVMIRPGARQADITATFSIDNDGAAAAWLVGHDLPGEDGEYLLRRTLTGEGRSKAYINGNPVPVQLLRELGELLIDIHGQHAHQSLLKRPQQMALLDTYAAHLPLTRQVAEAYRDWKRLRDELEALRGAGEARAAQLDLLRYQVRELTDLNPLENETAELEQEHQRLAHSQQLENTCQQALSEMEQSDERSLIDRVQRINNELRHLLHFDPGLQAVTEFLDGAAIQLQEAATELRRYLDRMETDPQRLEWVDRRLSALHDVARKHRVPPAGLYARLQELGQELAALDTTEQRVDEVAARLDDAREGYRQAAGALSARRLKAAQELAGKVTKTVRQLGIPEGRFEIEFETLNEGDMGEGGLERCEFLVATGARMPLRPLAKVASGGELSRISLAIQAITAQKDGAPTLIFDEVDAGIGGRVAEMVGQHLRDLARYRQIICVTHLPQVAALTQHHYRVSKLGGKGMASARIERLDEAERREEVARMLGGVEITAQTRAHAAEMITRGRERA
jgi:DNA repair protein RecN (Recombination protein N)